MNYRIGQGFDVHRLVKGRKLLLGAVQVPFELGLAGHSDADVLLHACIDALLGAAALGDIGQHFPNTDEVWRDFSSLELLRLTWDKVSALGWQLNNLDAHVHCEVPKLLPYISEMRSNIAAVLRTTVEAINIKAGTNEGLGYIGRGEGIAASAIVLLCRN